ncbi:zinc finger protein [Trypanosoma melophagium]|uniref:zinc finger protein n=2 Tax=Trypanosoma melophagium TaxID=715481 RepID=UPI003519FF84|nr:zinc finger protein [Trypanosoma melophagium]
MSRSVPWRTNCPQIVKDILEQLPSSQLLLVKRIGPTSFLLSGRDGRHKYKTSIGDPHYCSCGVGSELCVHILFVLCKVFFLPKENPFVWQRSLVAAEIDELLRAETKVKNKQKRVEGAGPALPRQVEEGDVCPICFEELDNNTPLTYCQGGCGKHLHVRCFKLYRRHNSAVSLRCPYCRVLWVNDPGAVSKRCSGCKKYANGQCYTCLFCQEYLLCGNCFHCTDAHSNHPFSLLGTTEVSERVSRQAVLSVPLVPEPTPRVSADVIPLMYRELDPNDYEILLQLDENNNRRVLTLEQFMSLRREKWNSSLGVETCNICLDLFDVSSSCVWLPCGHFFHVSCAQRWVTEHSAVCPIDHQPVMVFSGESTLTEVSLPALPNVSNDQNDRNHHRRRPVQRLRQEIPVVSNSSRRMVRPTRQRIERRRVVDAGTVSLPRLELQVVPLGVVPRRDQNAERFRYGGT